VSVGQSDALTPEQPDEPMPEAPADAALGEAVASDPGDDDEYGDDWSLGEILLSVPLFLAAGWFLQFALTQLAADASMGTSGSSSIGRSSAMVSAMAVAMLVGAIAWVKPSTNRWLWSILALVCLPPTYFGIVWLTSGQVSVRASSVASTLGVIFWLGGPPYLFVLSLTRIFRRR